MASRSDGMAFHIQPVGADADRSGFPWPETDPRCHRPL